MGSTSLTRSNVCLALGALAVAMLGGCLDDPTEVIVVADTDLTPTVDYNGIEFTIATVFNPLQPQFVGWSTQLPATMGFVPNENGPTQFDIVVRASRAPGDAAIVSKRVSNIRFVSGEMRVLFVPLLRACACQGTNCPSARECLNENEPVLAPFDEDNLPRLN